MKEFSLSWKIVVICVLSSGIAVLVSQAPSLITRVNADNVGSSVTVSNAAPAITVSPAESTESTTTSPTNAGSDVTFTATADDPNNDAYYLILCSTDAVTAGGGTGDAPACNGGTEWCVSTSTTDGTQATCAYTTQNGDSETNNWYGFVCDATSCAASDQGSGNSGSPFYVNHRPSFSAVGDDDPANPGDNVTVSATASDSDTTGSSDTVKLIVCDTSGFSGGACTSSELCSSSLTASDPQCSFAISTPTADNTYSYYPFIIDSHSFASSDAAQGSAVNYTVSNVAPSLSSTTINGASDITLTEGTTTSVVVSATVTDNNGCSDLSTVVAEIYRSGIGQASCSVTDEDNCYTGISCSINTGANDCTGASDSSAQYDCTFSVEYYADSTTAGTEYPTEDWSAYVTATDDDAAADNASPATAVEMNTLVALDISGSPSYGTFGAGDGDSTLDV
ncbi:hypothetical protein H6764_02015, partial [Candidatus Nomurabacteria bacterium]|nr:hypothetical protein [Candidatus Nomurabacteria bacterium]